MNADYGAIRQKGGNGNFVQMYSNFVSPVERKKWSTTEGRPFVSGNFRLIFAYWLHFNRLNRQFWQMESAQPFVTCCKSILAVKLKIIKLQSGIDIRTKNFLFGTDSC